MGIAFAVHHVLPHQVEDIEIMLATVYVLHFLAQPLVVSVMAGVAVIKAQTVYPRVVEKERTIKI